MATHVLTTRRALLTSAPVAAVTTAPVAYAAEGETPIMRLFREWDAAQAAEDAAYAAGESDENCDAKSNIRSALEKQMMATPSEDARDFLCKIAAQTAFGAFSLDDDERNPALWAEARALIGA